MTGDADAGADTATPWVRGPLRITRDVLADIEAHALECYPSESCGFVSGPATDPGLLDASTRETNEADKFHKLDPVRFPRTSRMYFKINELRAARAFDEAEKAGRPIKVIYHSHCDAGAYFSQEDAATFAAEGALTWPCAFIVVSVVRNVVMERRLWVHVPGTGEFRESELEPA